MSVKEQRVDDSLNNTPKALCYFKVYSNGVSKEIIKSESLRHNSTRKRWKR